MKFVYKKIWNELLRRFPAIAEEEVALPEDASLTAHSRAMEPVLRLVLRLRGYLSPILLQGEPGSGKEFWARTIHRLSPRADGPFVVVDLETIPARFIDTFLFGPASEKRLLVGKGEAGKVALAEGGTLYLHAVEMLPPESQEKLVRLLRRRFPAPGNNGNGNGSNGEKRHRQPARPLVRVLAGTAGNLEDFVQRGLFRRDLFYRLSVFPVQLPPLRSRAEDIPALAEYFLRRYGRILGKKAHRIHPDSFAWMMHYFWPGNLDELREFILLNLHFAPANDEVIQLRLLPDILRRTAATGQDEAVQHSNAQINRRRNIV